ncbi:MAG: peptide chain release factor N(5)-glutamine methyltransferase [Dehalococcoidia bacterium]|nr:peptide chain release factor N(5)-glutamine methyltransferase [Dehalococcoidia bacterium]
MNVAEVLATVASTLDVHGIPDHRLEAELLVGYVLGVSRARLYASLDEAVTDKQLQALDELVPLRVERRPLAYLLGHREFYSLDLLVSPAVMVPRPETETLVDRALQWAQAQGGRPLVVADVGTGSGAIAVTIALRFPSARVLAVDVSLQALSVAIANARRHGVAQRVSFVAGDLLEAVVGPLDLVLANLPYIPDADLDDLQAEVRVYEPRIALAGGRDGLDIIRRLLAQAGRVVRPGGLLLLEISPVQREAVLQEAAGAFPGAQIELVKDLGGWERVLAVQLSS